VADLDLKKDGLNVTPQQKRRAALTVVRGSRDRYEVVILLDMLGLLGDPDLRRAAHHG
jgi:hypothetical protein